MSIQVFRVAAREGTDSPGLPALAGLGQNAKHAAAGKRGEFGAGGGEGGLSPLNVPRYLLIT